MYVCVCKAVTDKQLNKAIADGQCTRRQLADSLGVGKNCGKCIKHVEQFLDTTINLCNADSEALHPVLPHSQHSSKVQKEVTCFDDLLAQPLMA